MAETYKTIAIIAYTLSGVFFISAVIVWFRLNIVQVIRELNIVVLRKNHKVGNKKQNLGSVSVVDHSVPTGGEATELIDRDGSAVTEMLNEGSESTHKIFKNQEITANIQTEFNTQIFEDDTESEFEEETTGELVAPENNSDFRIIESIIIIHTEEVI